MGFHFNMLMKFSEISLVIVGLDLIMTMILDSSSEIKEMDKIVNFL
jgi:hypothetical protein